MILDLNSIFLISIAATVLIYFMIMGAAFIRPFASYLDYDRHVFSALGLYTIGIGLVFLSTQLPSILEWQAVYLLLMAGVLFPVMYFAKRWQVNGRPYMPETKFSGSVTTLYDFTPKYAFVKVFEIMFQNLCAASVIFTYFELTNDVLLTSLYFALTFATLHAPSIYFLGRAWTFFIGIAFLLIFAITPLVILIPYGFGVLFVFHISCYIIFLLDMQRRFSKRRISL